MKDAINNEIKQLLGMDEILPGSHKYLAHYSTALKNVVNRLTPEQHIELELIADKWSKKGFPDELRRRYVVRPDRIIRVN